MFRLLEKEREVSDRPDARDLQLAAALTVRFEGVHFAYDTGGSGEGRPSDPAGRELRDPSGRTVAVVGPSGASKSHAVAPAVPLL